MNVEAWVWISLPLLCLLLIHLGDQSERTHRAIQNVVVVALAVFVIFAVGGW